MVGLVQQRHHGSGATHRRPQTQGNAQRHFAAARGFHHFIQSFRDESVSVTRQHAGKCRDEFLFQGRRLGGEYSQQSQQEEQQRKNRKQEVIGQFGGATENVVVVNFRPHALSQLHGP